MTEVVRDSRPAIRRGSSSLFRGRRDKPFKHPDSDVQARINLGKDDREYKYILIRLDLELRVLNFATPISSTL